MAAREASPLASPCRGDGPGEFGFGEGMDVDDFRGSTAVDEEGFIYVADIENDRIQVFAP